jgi:hypothetical protein
MNLEGSGHCLFKTLAQHLSWEVKEN